MKKVLAVLLVLLLTAAGLCTYAADTVSVAVTIADENGDLVLAAAKVQVSDEDDDGAVTINDALIAAHETYYDGGAKAGYNSFASEFGQSMSMLWGFENGTGYGYWINASSALSLLDPVTDGDLVTAFIYTDTDGWSDAFCTLTADAAPVAGEAFTLSLQAASYDADWNLVFLPVEGAVISIDGVDSAFVTDADGKVSVTFDAAGSYLLSASSDSQVLVPPALSLRVAAADTPVEAPETGDSSPIALYALLFAAAACGLGVTLYRGRKIHEN